MEHFNAGTLDGEPVEFDRTVHGPVIGYATSNGRRYAISSKRSSYGKDTVDQLFYRRLSTGRVDSARSFYNAANKTPQTFNSFYIDAKDVAMFTSGLLPIRHRHVDPGLPTKGTGKFEWQGFLSKNKHMHGKNPKDGTLTNWNNISAHGFGAADDNWGGNGSAARVDLLDYNLDRLQNKRGEWSLATVTSAMNAGATQDVRAIDTVPLLRQLLDGSSAPNEQARRMVDLLGAWRANGGNRLDLDGDGLIDDPGAAIMDGAWNRVADAFMRPRIGPQLDELNSLFSRFNAPPGGQYDGWYQYFERDIRSLLGKRVKQPFQNSYCGAGKEGACQQAIWEAIAAAGEALTAEQGTADPAAWRASATDEEITFAPINIETMAYTNRPTGIQQVISFRK
jgi:acyl-homoserine lactone acylase PvdQ